MNTTIKIHNQIINIHNIICSFIIHMNQGDRNYSLSRYGYTDINDIMFTIRDTVLSQI